MRIVIAVLVAALLAAAPASAGIIFVKADGTGDYATIQAALDAAAEGSIIELADGTYTGAGNRDLDFKGKSLILRSQSGKPASCIINCQGSYENAHRGFRFHTAETSGSILKGITIRHGYADYGGGIRLESTSPRIVGVVVDSCEAENDGGGIHCYLGTPVLDNLVVSYNYASGKGGGLYLRGGDNLRNLLIVHNEAYRGGGLFADYVDLNLYNCTFHLNEGSASEGGNAAYGDHGGGTTLSNCIVAAQMGPGVSLLYALAAYSDIVGGFTGTGNINADPLFTAGPGGGYYLQTTSPCVNAGSANAATLTFTSGDGTAAYNRLTTRTDETNDAGVVDMGYHHGHFNAIYVPDRYATVQAALDSVFSGERVVARAGTYHQRIDFKGKAVVLEGSGSLGATILDGDDDGTVVTFQTSEGRGSVLRNFVVEDGTAAYGGGVVVLSCGPTLDANLIQQNVATQSGGGLYSEFSRTLLTGNTLMSNTATDRGAGAYFAGGTTNVVLTGNTVRNNTGASSGGGLAFVWGHADLSGNFVVSNSSVQGGGIHSTYTTVQVTGCTVAQNYSSGGQGGAAYIEGAALTLDHAILAFNGWAGSAPAVTCGLSGTATASCTDVYGNIGGDWASGLAGQGGSNNNLCVNPLFCNSGGYDYHLHSNSQCAPANNPACGQVGALGVGCSEYVLNVPDDYRTIQEAIDAAWNGLSVVVANGTYTGTGNRDLDFKGKAITVRSFDGDPASCIIDCQGSSGSPHRGFYFHTGENSTSRLTGIGIVNGYIAGTGSGGGINCLSSSPLITNCAIENCYAYDGGGLFAYQSAPIIENCSFLNDSASDAGGGLMANTSTPQLAECWFEGCGALWGGGAVYDHLSSSSIRDGVFLANTSQHWGGAVHSAQSTSRTQVQGCLFASNTAAEGGAVYSRAGAIATLVECTLYGNTATSYGGGLCATSSGGANVTNSILWANTCSTGAQLSDRFSSTVTVGCTDIQGGQAAVNKDGTSTLTWNPGNLDSNPYFCDPTHGVFTLDAASPCLPAHNSCAVRMGAYDQGCAVVGVEDPAGPGSATLALAPARPNPFRSLTEVTFSLPVAAHVRLEVFDVTGRLVATLSDGACAAGTHHGTWDGRDDSGHPVASGVHFLKLEALGRTLTRRVVIIR